jgi:hypothetical protein
MAAARGWRSSKCRSFVLWDWTLHHCHRRTIAVLSTGVIPPRNNAEASILILVLSVATWYQAMRFSHQGAVIVTWTRPLQNII